MWRVMIGRESGNSQHLSHAKEMKHFQNQPTIDKKNFDKHI